MIFLPVFVGVHKIPAGSSEDMIQNGWNSYKAEAQKRGLKPIRVRYNMEKGVAYCETEANSENEVREAHQGVQVPLEDVIEVKSTLE